MVLSRHFQRVLFADFEKLVEAAKADGAIAHLIVLLGGEAGLRCGEIMALEWRDVDLTNRPNLDRTLRVASAAQHHLR